MNCKILIIALVVITSACGKKTDETKPIRKDVIETVFASGMLQAGGTYNLTAKTSGYLTEVNFDENDIVKPETILAKIDNPESIYNRRKATALYEISKMNTTDRAPSIIQAKNSFMTSQKQWAIDSMRYERYKKLYEANAVSRVDYENILKEYENAKVNYANAFQNYMYVKQQAEQDLIINKTQRDVNAAEAGNNLVKAPFKGKVYEKRKEQGDFVMTGDIIAVIGDPQFIFAKVNIDEGSIGKIKIGQEATVVLNTQEEKKYKGKVADILPTFDEATQSFICEIHFTDTVNFNIIKTQLQANIIVGTSKNALLIPRRYLNYDNTVNVKGTEEPLKVQTKFVSTEWVQVVSGIDDNAILITSN